jgi:hypothetical protein
MTAVNWNDILIVKLWYIQLKAFQCCGKLTLKITGSVGSATQPGRHAVAEAFGNGRRINEILWICDQHMTCAAHRLHNRNLLVKFVADRSILYTLTLQCFQNANNIS